MLISGVIHSVKAVFDFVDEARLVQCTDNAFIEDRLASVTRVLLFEFEPARYDTQPIMSPPYAYLPRFAIGGFFEKSQGFGCQ